MLQLSSSDFAAEDEMCNRFGKCSQPSANQTTTTLANQTTTTPVLAAPPLTAIVGATVAVGVVLLVLLIVGAVPLVVLMRRQERTKREKIGKVEELGVKISTSDVIVQCDIAYIECAVFCPRIILVHYCYFVIDLLIIASDIVRPPLVLLTRW